MKLKYCVYKIKYMQAFLLIICDTGKEKQVYKILQSVEGIKEVQATHGVYDVIAKLESKTVRELNDMVSLKILKIKSIHSILMLQVAS
ncbi:MAG: Lrp/AsnC ligand binding domain-containing protein [Nitrosotalea sp.]